MSAGTGKRILLGKLGLDCHDTGIVTVSNMLKNAGYEVIYMGLHNSAEKLVSAAIEEDADAIGTSFLSGQHMTQMRDLMDKMKKAGLDIPVFCGGVIPKEDAAALKDLGVSEVLLPGTLKDDLLAAVKRAV